ncbi:MAG: matrixin family metalloprotease [Bacteriovoracaceae bacterium]|jgi:hypothetical protein|nr:matrixin family metalloprotease [Bacteriovoracaceae bacterium]
MIRNTVLLFIVAFLFNSNDALSYNYTTDFQSGYYWGSLPITLNKFVIDSSEGPLLESLVNESIEEWNTSAGRTIWETTPGYSQGPYTGNYIRWSNNFAEETGFDDENTLAITIRYQSGTNITKTEIILNGNLDYLVANTNGALKATILHEIGHTIGLGHSDEYAIMAAYLTNLTVLQSDDIAGVNAVVDETYYRQQTGFVASGASLSSDTSASGSDGNFSCAPSAFAGDRSSGSLSFLDRYSGILSLLLGIFLVKLLKILLRKSLQAIK